MDRDAQATLSADTGPEPSSEGSTTAQLKADVSSGDGNRRILNTDLGLSPLGTDDEAGGTTPSPQLIDQVRRLEAQTRPGAATAPGQHDQAPRLVPTGLLLTLAVVIALAAVWFFLLRA